MKPLHDDNSRSHETPTESATDDFTAGFTGGEETPQLEAEFESMNRSSQSHRRGLLLITGVLLATLSGLAWDRLPKTFLKSGGTMRSAFRSVTESARQYTVRFDKRGEVCALGVIVRADGIVLSKASELSETEQCSLADGRTFVAQRIQSYEELDLALYRLSGKQLDLPVVRWSDRELPQGAWLISVGVDATPLGLGIVSVPPREISRRIGFLGVRVSDRTAAIVRVIEDSAAERAGFRAGDLVTHVGEQPVRTQRQLIRAIKRYRPDEPVPFTVVREGSNLVLRATLGEEDEPPTGNRNTKNFSRRRSGFPLALEHDTDLSAKQCGGVVISIDGKAVALNIARMGRTGCYALPSPLVQSFLRRALSSPQLKISRN